jgi:hypothetical protein
MREKERNSNVVFLVSVPSSTDFQVINTNGCLGGGIDDEETGEEDCKNSSVAGASSE